MIEKKSDDADDESAWTPDQHGALVELIEIQPDLTEIVDDRRQRRKFVDWARRVIHAVVEFLKWAAMLGAAVAAARTLLQGWLK